MEVEADQPSIVKPKINRRERRFASPSVADTKGIFHYFYRIYFDKKKIKQIISVFTSTVLYVLLQ